MTHNIWGPKSDPKVKDLIPLAKKGTYHASAQVTATHIPSMMASKIEVFPPSAEMMISDQMIQDTWMDQKTLIASIAKQIGRDIAKQVETQILKAYEMSASEAMKQVDEAKIAFLKSDHGKFWPKDTVDSIFSMPSLQTAPNKFEPMSLDAPVDWIGKVKEFKKKAEDEYIQVSYVSNLDVEYQQYVNDAAYAKPPGVYVEPDVHIKPEKKAAKNEIVKVFHDLIPGFAQMRDKCPDCDATGWLQNVIVHLNDQHKWTREAIADWLETLDHDLTLKTPEEVKNAEHTH